MKKINLNNYINLTLFLYILSLYLFTFNEHLYIYSNILAFMLIFYIGVNLLVTKKKLVINGFLISHMLFVLICIFSVFNAIDQSVAISRIRTLLLIAIFIFVFINYIDTYSKLEKLIYSFVYSGLFSSIYILLISDFSSIKRFGNELGNVNTIGMIIGISTIFSLYLILEKKKIKYYLYFIIMFITILLTGSRKSLIFIIGNIFLILYLKNRKNIKNLIKLLLICMILILFVLYLLFNVSIFYEIIGIRIENLYNFILGEDVNEGSVYARYHMILSGIEMFKERPILGYGIDNFRVLYNMVYGGRYTYAHNNYIELLVDIGLIGVFSYYLTHILVLKKLIKSEKDYKYINIYYIFISIIILYCVLSVSLVYYYNKHFNILIATASVIDRIEKLGNKSKKLNDINRYNIDEVKL